MSAPYDENKHPRGFGGRWTSGPGKSPAAHAFRGPRRPRPPIAKRDHAVSPTTPRLPRGIAIRGGITQGSE